MDRRILVLPVASAVLLLVLLSRPDITGFMVAAPSAPSSEISANVSISIKEDGFIPDGSVVNVLLDDRSSSMGFSEFVARTGATVNRTSRVASGSEEYGYGGTHTYSLDISEFGIDTNVAKGTHTLAFSVSLGERVFSSSSQDIEVE